MQPKSHTPFFAPSQKTMNSNTNNINNNSNNNNINNSNNRISATRNGNSTTQACAACKYQRRKCAPDCILAPYFPHDRQRQFLNAHKLFGVSNITKIIKYLSPHDKDQAMRTIIYQSDMRATDPVGGCYRYIVDLQAQIEYYRAELELVLQQLAICRAQHQQQQHGMYAPTGNNVNVGVTGDGEVLNADPLGLYSQQQQQHHYQCLQAQPEQYVMVHENNGHGSENSNGDPLQEQMNTWALQNTLSSLSLQGQNSNVSDEYDHKPVVIDLDSDARSELGFESEELVHHRSDEAILFKIDDAVIKAEAECIQQVQDHDLKGAATSFTLADCTC